MRPLLPLLCLLLIPPAPAPAGEPATPPPADVGNLLPQGIDVSWHSGAVDWAAVKEAGHTFAFVKATEGLDLKDKLFDHHWPAMKEAGLLRGAYHFYVTEDDPEAQAKFFIQTVPLGSGDLAPVVDVEVLGHDTQPGLADRLAVFLARLEAHYGVKPILYTSPNFWNQNLNDRFGDHPLWVAEYGVDAPKLPEGWGAWHLWQFEENATVPGVEKSADVSHVNRSGDADLSLLLVP